MKIDEIIKEFNEKYAPEKASYYYDKDSHGYIFDVDIKFSDSSGCGMNKKLPLELSLTTEQVDTKLTDMFLTVKNAVGKYND